MARPTTRRRAPSRRAAGFTLIELMVALVAGAMAITSIYFVASSSSRHFHEQQRIAQGQMSLRTAMGQLRRDFSRAGYLASPNTAREDACGMTPAVIPFGAILVDDDAATSALDLPGVNGVQADRVELTGNFATADAYKASGTQSTTQLMFSKTWQAFRRSFGAEDLSEYSSALFDAAFAPGRMVLVAHDARGYRFFAEISAVSGSSSPPTITLDRSLPACFGRCEGFGCTVSPVSRIEYTVLDMSDTSLTALDPSSPLVGTQGPVLVRRELTFDATPTVVANSERVVAEYVANFDVDVISDTTVTAGALPSLALQDDAAAETLTAANPHRTRNAVISLSVRTATEDPRFPFVASSGLTRYELDTGLEGAARVRTSNIEVLLPNVAARNIRP